MQDQLEEERNARRRASQERAERLLLEEGSGWEGSLTPTRGQSPAEGRQESLSKKGSLGIRTKPVGPQEVHALQTNQFDIGIGEVAGFGAPAPSPPRTAKNSPASRAASIKARWAKKEADKQKNQAQMAAVPPRCARRRHRRRDWSLLSR